jgi:excisionase family DNA binding protein
MKPMTRSELAKYLDCSEDVLAQMAHRGTGPRYVKISGRFVRYLPEDVDEWLRSNLVTSSKDVKGGDAA